MVPGGGSNSFSGNEDLSCSQSLMSSGAGSYTTSPPPPSPIKGTDKRYQSNHNIDLKTDMLMSSGSGSNTTRGPHILKGTDQSKGKTVSKTLA